MNIEESIEQIETLIEAWKLDEAELNQTDINAMQVLLKENQELKKQLDKANDELYTLKNKYNIRLLNQISENIEPDCEDYYLAEIETKANEYDLIQTQQQEFIKYLENEIERKRFNATCMFEYNDTVLPLKHCLQKYKEITEISDENNKQ